MFDKELKNRVSQGWETKGDMIQLHKALAGGWNVPLETKK